MACTLRCMQNHAVTAIRQPLHGLLIVRTTADASTHARCCSLCARTPNGVPAACWCTMASAQPVWRSPPPRSHISAHTGDSRRCNNRPQQAAGSQQHQGRPPHRRSHRCPWAAGSRHCCIVRMLAIRAQAAAATRFVSQSCLPPPPPPRTRCTVAAACCCRLATPPLPLLLPRLSAGRAASTARGADDGTSMCW